MPAKSGLPPRASDQSPGHLQTMAVSNRALRAIRTREATVLVLYQGTDGEFAQTEPIFEQIIGSLTFAAGDGIEELDEDASSQSA